MKYLKVGVAAAAILLGWNSLAKAAPVTLATLPGTAIFGPAGSTVGWGYQITNGTANWVETLNLTADIFTSGMPLSIFDFPAIAPNSSLSVSFSQVVTGACPAPDCGIFEFTWNAGVAAGTTNSGTFTITSEFFGTNPITDPNAVDLGPAPEMTALYSVSVSGGTGVPEPSTFLPLLSGFGALLVMRKSRWR